MVTELSVRPWGAVNPPSHWFSMILALFASIVAARPVTADGQAVVTSTGGTRTRSIQ